MSKENIDIRYTELNDEKYLLSWLKDATNLQWFPMSEIDLEISVKNWIGFSRFSASLTATIDNEPIGMVTLFLMPYRKVAHNASFYLIVDQKQNFSAIAEPLLRNIANLAKNYFHLESIYVEVFESSPLIPILRQNHFELFAEQPHFVKENGVYRKRLLFDQNFIKEKTNG